MVLVFEIQGGMILVFGKFGGELRSYFLRQTPSPSDLALVIDGYVEKNSPVS